jgi:hypothetical protein
MKNLISIALTTTVLAHPFVGQNLDKNVLRHQDGRVTARLSHKETVQISSFKHDT